MEKYRALYERYIDRYNAGDLDGVMDLYAEDAVQLMPDGLFEGRTAIKDRLAVELNAFSDIAYRYDSYVEEDGARPSVRQAGAPAGHTVIRSAGTDRRALTIPLT